MCLLNVFLFKMSDTETDSESDDEIATGGRRIRSVTYESHLHAFEIDIKSNSRLAFRGPHRPLCGRHTVDEFIDLIRLQFKGCSHVDIEYFSWKNSMCFYL